MADYKLTYFTLKGLAEPIRFLLFYSDIEFEDIRLEGEEWPNIKPTTPFGKLPLLEVNGKKLHQSVAISRYLGKKAGIAGKDEWEDLIIDMIVETIYDLKDAIISWMSERNEEAKASKHKVLLNETLPFYLTKLDKTIKENGGYLANGKFSWADIFFVALIDSFNFVLGFNFTENYSNIQGLYKKVTEIPKIKSWIDKRPEDRFPKFS